MRLTGQLNNYNRKSNDEIHAKKYPASGDCLSDLLARHIFNDRPFG